MPVLYKTHVGTCIHLKDGTTWTIPTDGVSWMLRYSHRQFNRNEALQLASIMDSFMALLEASQKRRNEIIQKMNMEHKRYRIRWKHKDADEWRYGHGTMNYANAKDWADEMNRKSLYFIHEIVEVTDEQNETK